MPSIFSKALLYAVPYGLTIGLFALFFTTQKVENNDFSLVRLIVLFLFFPILFKYFLQLFIAPWFEMVSTRQEKRLCASEKRPKVSVLIPAWNEEVGILHTVKSITESTYRNVEAIVIDDGSTDATGRKVRSFIAEHRTETDAIPVRCVHQKNGGKSKALNRGLELATGDIIVTIDADSVVDRDAILEFVKVFRDPSIMSVAGNVKIGNRSQAIGLVQQLEYLYGFYFKKADSLLNAIYIVGGAAAAYRREVFAELGGFDETIITEDIELSTRIQNAGYAIAYAPKAVVYTEGPTELSGLFKQRLRWKYGRLLTFYRYRHLFFSLRKKHSKFLTFFSLPISLFAEVLLFFEGLLLTVFYGYTFITHDYLPLVVNMILLTAVVSLQIATDVKRRANRNLFLLAPIAWCLFYFIDFVEYQALMRSLWRLVKKEQVKWQRWTRSGVFEAQGELSS